jgi:hypothetical protein
MKSLRKKNKFMIQKLFAHYKTTSAGLVMILGSVVHLVFAVRAHTADENTWTISLTAIVAGIGLLVSGDASNSEKNAVAIDTINQVGMNPAAPTLASTPPEIPPTI